MSSCDSCGHTSAEEFKFCPECGERVPAIARETRKTVTILFCDLVGSTQLAERLDQESVRRVLSRYYDTVRSAVERQGGSIEKFIGDAVMAVFGVPVLHEDDALRAIRAAAELRDALGPLNEELARDYGTTLALRIGVNTGEVLTGTPERLATGDAVNVAAHLEQSADPGEILLGAMTVAHASDEVLAEPLPSLTLRGKSGTVPAWRLLGVREEKEGDGEQVPAAPMVGRASELRRLDEAFARSVDERSARLVTVAGDAGDWYRRA